MYESPIKLSMEEIAEDIHKNLDECIVESIARYGIAIDKDSLIRALTYDRDQYQKGYADAKAEQSWIPVEKGLPEERDWYLGIFKEPDTGWINPIPFICDYLLGTKTKATTKEGWILKGFTDREEYIDYYFNLECVAWCHLPEPYMDLKYFI